MDGQQNQRLNYLSENYSYYPRADGAAPPYTGQPAAGGYHTGQPASGGYPTQQPAAMGSYTGYMPRDYPGYGAPLNHAGAQPAAQPAAAAYNPYGMPAQPAAMGYGYPQPGMMPAGGSPEDRVVAALRPLFPDVKDQTLYTAARVYRTVEAAADWLNTMKRQGMLNGGMGAASQKRSTMSIREKFANRAAPGERPAMATPPPGLLKKKPAKKYNDDEFSGSDASDNDEEYDAHSQYEFELRVLKFINTAAREAIMDVTACTDEMVDAVIAKRPYANLHQIQKVDVPGAVKPAPGEKRKRGASKKPAGSRIVDASLSTLRGYEAVDSLIQECAKLGKDVQRGIQAWGVDPKGGKELEIIELNKNEVSGGYFTEQPALLGPDVELKNYQQVGVNWLSLLYNRRLSCILADEMGLGKTCQVISFFAHLKEIGQRGPHLVVCPASTLENWLRELNRFCPNLVVEPYYGSQNERVDIRENIIAAGSNFDVMVTTYNLATGGKQDTGFLKSMRFNVCVYDEGHLLKNSQSERYNKLMKLRANFRVLLTGTPLQNNLRELVSLLSFILPNLFERNKDDLLEVFKFKAKTRASPSEADQRSQLLSEQRIIKAKTMMSPFILRRRKDQVLQLLPAKSHEIIHCDMVDVQRTLYQRELASNKKGIKEANDEVKADQETGQTASKKGKQATLALDNVLMQLRKAALHPLLFRLHYNDAKLKKMTHDIMQESTYKDANADYIFEDMQYMNDFELNRLCKTFPTSMGRYILDDEAYSDSGKVQKLKELIVPMKAQGDRILIFSQFTQVLDILEKVLNIMDFKFLRLDGQTPVEERQDLLDKYYDDESITVFLLSTKAGGFGINLAVANVVIIFDLSFNPHDDKQAEDRAHRVGQTRTVRVIRMVTKDSIEESILQLANTKLALDRQVSEENDEVDPESEALVADMVLESAPTRAPSEIPVASTASPVSMPSTSMPSAMVSSATVSSTPVETPVSKKEDMTPELVDTDDSELSGVDDDDDEDLSFGGRTNGQRRTSSRRAGAQRVRGSLKEESDDDDFDSRRDDDEDDEEEEDDAEDEDDEETPVKDEPDLKQEYLITLKYKTVPVAE